MKKIAIIGSGIAGMTSAYLLNKKHNIKVFEKNDYIGGHTATVDVNVNNEQHAIDTGFIVFNDRTYPLFEKLLAQLDVKTKPTQMSFSVHNVNTGFEYNGHTFSTLFAQRRNIFRPKFWRLLEDIVRFNKLCKSLYESQNFDGVETLGKLLDKHQFGDFFCEHYILPMGAAIWSTSIAQMEAFETQFFVRFFYNHGLLNISDRPQWYVIEGGSRSYIDPLIDSFKDKIVLNADIESVHRSDDAVVIYFADGSSEHFDDVVFACHSDQALALINAPSEEEKAVLGQIPYTANSVILHTDTRVLPKRKKAWASWNYRLDGDVEAPAAVSYQMNILQGIDSETQFCVTLNNDEIVAKEHVLRRFTYHHPVFNQQSMAAQRRKDEIDGKNRSYFCGAYWYNGFHEDGVRSAVDIAKKLGVEFA